MDARNYFNLLPNELLAGILSFTPDWRTFSLINQRCYGLTRQEKAIASAFSRQALMEVPWEEDFQNKVFILVAPYTTSLDLSGCKIKEGIVQLIAAKLVHLRSLNLHLCKYLTDNMIGKLKPLKNLTRLNIGQFIYQNSSLISYSSFENPLKLDFLKHHTGLKSLDLSGWKYPESELKHLKWVPRLEELFLMHPWTATMENLEFLRFVPSLKVLKLGFGKTALVPHSLKSLRHVAKLQTIDLTSSGFRGSDLIYLKHTPHLQSLSIGSTQYKKNSVSDKHLSELQHASQLTKLELDQLRCSNLALEFLSRLPQMEDLSLLGCQDINDDGLKYLSFFAQNIQTLRIGPYNYHSRDMINIAVHRNSQSLITDNGVEYLQKLENLAHLTFVCCNGITKHSCLILKNHPNLKSLKFYHCERIGPSSIKYLKKFQKLDKLVIFQCQYIEKNKINFLKNKLKNTKIIYIPKNNFHIN